MPATSHLNSTIDEMIAPETTVRRLANGAIDYTFYDARARCHRASAFRTAARLVVRLVRRACGAAPRPGAVEDQTYSTPHDRRISDGARHSATQARQPAQTPDRPVSDAA